MTTSKLINYTIREFVSENELELYAAKQDEIFTPEVVDEFKKAGNMPNEYVADFVTAKSGLAVLEKAVLSQKNFTWA